MSETTTAPAFRSETDVLLGGGRAMRVQLCLPAGPPPAGGWPGVLVIHEMFGLTEDIRAIGQRFADRGWAAVLPDLLSTGPSLGCLVRALKEATSGRPGRLTSDLDVVRAWLASRPDVDGGRIATIGFCLGGGLAMLLGSSSDGIRAVAANYGEPPKTDVLRSSPPVVASYGARDKVMGPKAKVLERRLSEVGVAHSVESYPAAGHSFMTPPVTGVPRLITLVVGPLMHGGYEAVSADAAWERVWSWFDQHVAAG